MIDHKTLFLTSGCSPATLLVVLQQGQGYNKVVLLNDVFSMIFAKMYSHASL